MFSMTHSEAVCSQAWCYKTTPFYGGNALAIPTLNHLNPIWLRGVPQGSVFIFYAIVGKAFAENSRSTNLQRVAVQRVVSLSSGYFLQQPFPQKGHWG